MRGLPNLLALALVILTACSGPRSRLRPEAQTELVTLDAGENGLCHVHSEHVDRKAPCTEIAALMRSELHVPNQEAVSLRVEKMVRYEEVAGLLRTLKEAGYRIQKLGYVNVSQ